jgi:uncharacterized protein with ParB-like and HNH nuclease domain
MATESMSKKGWENKERRELCVRVYNSAIINKIDHEEALKRAIKVIDKIFETYGEEDISNIKPL